MLHAVSRLNGNDPPVHPLMLLAGLRASEALPLVCANEEGRGESLAAEGKDVDLAFSGAVSPPRLGVAGHHSKAKVIAEAFHVVDDCDVGVGNGHSTVLVYATISRNQPRQPTGEVCGALIHCGQGGLPRPRQLVAHVSEVPAVALRGQPACSRDLATSILGPWKYAVHPLFVVVPSPNVNPAIIPGRV